MRLKDASYINRHVLPETTDPDFSFRYIDISAVDSSGRIAIPHESTRFESAPSRARRLAPEGSTVVSTVRTYLRAIAQVPHFDEPLAFSTGFAVVEARSVAEDRFLAYLCRSQPFIDEVVARSVGVSYPAISPGELGNIHITLPSLDKQRRVADFLDAAISDIDTVIRVRNHQISVLDELKLSMASNIIPKSRANFVRLGYLATIQSGVTVDVAREVQPDSVTLPYLRVANVQDGYVDLDSIQEITVDRPAARSAMLKRGDVLMTEGGDLDKLGRGTVWLDQIENCLHQNHVFAVRPDKKKVNPAYLALITRTSYARSYFESTGTKTTNLASTNSSKIRDFRIPLIDIASQARVTDEISSKLRDISQLEMAIRRQHLLLTERRQALITAAVTGQLDISGGIAA